MIVLAKHMIQFEQETIANVQYNAESVKCVVP